ncbi:MAG: methylenetetrahydrofolate--tRNA-(uracil-5-)-methyltransferase [Thermotogota bacterium]|nr:methylenetetrahydrofolate--tRNA-(uracil-5-)-methyltransferase [Thermotogota bacterium]
MRDTYVHVVGGGLAGSEIALQLASRGIHVVLHEMRPMEVTKVHTSAMFAELVCSNSLKSNDLSNAEGLLKEELRMLGSKLLQIAEKCAVPAGKSLAVDRKRFSEMVSEALWNENRIIIRRELIEQIPLEDNTLWVIATGPVTHRRFAGWLQKLTGGFLHFFDAVSPIIYADSIDMQKVYVADRYGKGSGDYLNCPMNEEEYEIFWKELVNAETVEVHDFDKGLLFERCQPIEEIARSGKDALRYGPLKPVGLLDPRTGKEPYAVVQLRKENREGTLYSLVGFQTRLRWKEQKRIIRLIPGLEKAEIARYGVIHKNVYIEANRVLDDFLRLRKHKKLFFAGQVAGFEGYVSAIATGLFVAFNIYRSLSGQDMTSFPRETMLGSLVNAVVHHEGTLKPMYANFGLLPPLALRGSRLEKRLEMSKRALSAMKEFLDSEGKAWQTFRSRSALTS